MKLLSWNVNGIRAVEKKGFLDWLHQASPDVLCLQETKAHPDQLSSALTAPEGYYSFWSSAQRKGYSGVAVYAKTRPSKVEEGLGADEFDAEGRVLICTFSRFVLFNLYVPNGGSGNKRVPFKMAFYGCLLKKLEKLRKAGQAVVICGDINTAHMEIDLARPRENEKNTGFLPEERAWLTRFLDLGYIDTFRHFHKGPGHYSWWDYKTKARERDVGWRIDYFFMTPDLLPRLQDAFILKDVLGSDHCPVGIVLSP
ncbi:MAG TPA: exodeoxyribonuclease III [Candidatus Omnitrophota bacterium]|nr:exodeoxyribonuclease III [Candidatus Omnitrophota bacterium]HQO58664.1 exodeoxyribonuclease III [Candidatus Omnitrophota bacterium]